MTRRLKTAWRWFWFEPAPPFALAATRIVVAYISLFFLLGRVRAFPSLPLVRFPAILQTDPGTVYAAYAANRPGMWFPTSYMDLFNIPPPTQEVLTAAYMAALAGSLLLMVGLLTRVAAVVSAASLLYLLGMINSWGKVNHGYHVLGFALLMLVFARSGAAWSLDSLIRRRLRSDPALPACTPSWRFRWPVVAIQLGYALMFFFAGWNKLRTSGIAWTFSENMRNTLVFQNTLVRDYDGASWLVRTASQLDQPWLWFTLGFGALFAELCFPAIVFLRPFPWARRAFLLLGVFLVAGLDLMMQLPNPALLGLLLVFIDWNAVRERFLSLFSQRQPAPQ